MTLPPSIGIRPALFAGWIIALASGVASAATLADLELAGDWKVQVTVTEPRPCSRTLRIARPVSVSVTAEKIDSLPLFNANAGGWAKGAQLRGVRAQETTTPGLLDPTNLVLRAGRRPYSAILRRGQDYEADLVWGTIGRCPGGAIKAGQPVYASYRYVQLRIDAVVLTRARPDCAAEGRVAPRCTAGRPSLGQANVVWQISGCRAA